MMGNELAVMGEDTGVSLWRNPETVLAEAQQAATALIKIVGLKPKKVMFNGETYLEFEDWQTVSKFYGCTTKVVSTNFIEYGGVRGFEATAVVLDRHQNEIGRVDSMCLSDEENWGDVPKYEWVPELDASGKKIWIEGKNGKKGYFKSEKKEVGRFPKPLFQLRSMAQTRAQVKALRSIFAWVVVLAGYQPTPAEELTGNEFHDDGPPPDEKPPVDMPKAKVEAIDFSGAVIHSRKDGKDDTLWLNTTIGIVVVSANTAAKHPFGVGDKFSFKATEKMVKEVKLLLLQEVTEYVKAVVADEDPLPPMEDGPAPAREKDSMDEAIEEGVFDQKEPAGTSQELVGKKRQVRLWTLMSTNKQKTGLTNDIVHEILDAMEPPVKHLEDLGMDMYPTFERIMKGEEDWKPLHPKY
jgi:hypothetical protein